MGNLDELKATFNPKRKFQCSHSTIEVDGVFVRVSEDNDRVDRSWVPMRNTGSQARALLIDLEDILQDPAVIRSARVSTGRDTKEVDEKAQGMINFLWRGRHVTPFEGGVHFRLRCETPVPYAEPFFNIFASHNEFSGRYSVLDGAYYTPLSRSPEVLKEFEDAEREANEVYDSLLGMGLAKEMARFAHLYRFYTKFYMTISLRHLLEFLTYDFSHSQMAMNTHYIEMLDPLKEIIKCWTPWAHKAFEDNPRFISSRPIIDHKDRIDQAKKLLFESDKYKKYKVLDKGSLRIVDFWGDTDVAIASLDAFPNCFKGMDNIGMTFAIVMPIFVYRQWVRHRHGVMTKLTVDYDKVVNERLFYIPEKFRAQKGKVGHYIFEDMNETDGQKIKGILEQHVENACQRYLRLRNMEVASDLAAMNLPYVFYVPVTWSVPFTSLTNFFSLRTDSHAQSEMQQYSMAGWNGINEYFGVTGFNDSLEGLMKHLYYGDNSLIKGQ